MDTLVESPELDVTVHGVWVRSLTHDGFGRICYKVRNMQYEGSVEFLVMWEADADIGTRMPTASYATPEELMVRPYKPRPWATMPKEVVY